MLKRKAKKQLSTTSDEKLMLFISIVSRGLSAPVLKIFQKCDVSGQFVLTGEGTARKEIRNILGIEDNEKPSCRPLQRSEAGGCCQRAQIAGRHRRQKRKDPDLQLSAKPRDRSPHRTDPLFSPFFS